MDRKRLPGLSGTGILAGLMMGVFMASAGAQGVTERPGPVRSELVRRDALPRILAAGYLNPDAVSAVGGPNQPLSMVELSWYATLQRRAQANAQDPVAAINAMTLPGTVTSLDIEAVPQGPHAPHAPHNHAVRRYFNRQPAPVNRAVPNGMGIRVVPRFGGALPSPFQRGVQELPNRSSRPIR